jgi:hypothetical protein
LLKNNFLKEKAFEDIINQGIQNSLVNLPVGCARNGWRRMPVVHLKNSVTLLEYYSRDRVSSIRRLEKLIRKGGTNEMTLRNLAREKRAELNDWRMMNWGELRMMVALVSKDIKDIKRALGL